MLSKVGCTGKGTYCIIHFCEIPTQRQWRMPGERSWEKREQRACLVSTRLYCGKLKMLSRWTPMGTVLWPMSVLNAEDITPWTLSWWRKRRGRATHTQIRDENGFFSPQHSQHLQRRKPATFLNRGEHSFSGRLHHGRKPSHTNNEETGQASDKVTTTNEHFMPWPKSRPVVSMVDLRDI